jgi:hypothetical protein
VTVPILSLDPRLRGVVRGTSNVSLIIEPTYQNYLSDRIQPAYSDKIAPGLATARVSRLSFFVRQEIPAYQRTAASSEQECSLWLSL